jgi:methylated-DNA-[protein]-cysteine S-methyltransferase
MVNEGPDIQITVTCKGDQLLKVTLSSSTHFSYNIENASPKLKQALVDWLKSYADRKKKPFSIDLPVNSFTNKVLNYLCCIPSGETRSYKEVAIAVGNPKGSRAVGNACRGNPFPLFIPCHRVIASDGSFGGFSCGLELKKRLLKFEGVI